MSVSRLLLRTAVKNIQRREESESLRGNDRRRVSDEFLSLSYIRSGNAKAENPPRQSLMSLRFQRVVQRRRISVRDRGRMRFVKVIVTFLTPCSPDNFVGVAQRMWRRDEHS